MPNTTNFNWNTPADTDLVKDGAAAIRTLGNNIDASLVDLKGGTTGQVLAKASNADLDYTWSNVDPLTILDAKGDLITATAADTPARLALGTNNQVLTVDTSTSTGLKWATAAAGGITELASGNLSGNSTITLSSISASYKNLVIILRDFYPANTRAIYMRLNNDTTANRHLTAGYYHNFDGNQTTRAQLIDNSFLMTLIDVRNADNNNYLQATIYDYANTTTMKTGDVENAYLWTTGGTTNLLRDFTTITYTNTAAINRIDIIVEDAQNFSGGTYILYGVS